MRGRMEMKKRSGKKQKQKKTWKRRLLMKKIKYPKRRRLRSWKCKNHWSNTHLNMGYMGDRTAMSSLSMKRVFSRSTHRECLRFKREGREQRRFRNQRERIQSGRITQMSYQSMMGRKKKRRKTNQQFKNQTENLLVLLHFKKVTHRLE